MAVIVAWKGFVEILPHRDDQRTHPRAPSQKDIIFSTDLAHFVGHLRHDLIGHAGAGDPQGHADHPQIFLKAWRMSAMACGYNSVLEAGSKSKESRKTDPSGSASI